MFNPRTIHIPVYVFIALLVLMIVLLSAGYVGLGEKENFVLYRAFGLTRGGIFAWGCTLLVLASIYELSISVLLGEPIEGTWRARADSLRQAGISAAQRLFLRSSNARRERMLSALAAVVVIAIFWLLLRRSVVTLSE